MEKDNLQHNGQMTSGGDLSNRIKKTSNEGVFMSVSKKAEKLTTALYMLTDLINENDPMRHKIRETSIAVLSDTRGLSYAMTGDLYFHLARVISKSWEIMSLIEVCVVVGFISDMNYGILKNALIDFISDLRNRQKIEGFSNIQDLKIGVGESTNFKLKSDFFKLGQKDLADIMEESEKEEVNEKQDMVSPEKKIISRTLPKKEMSFIPNSEPKKISVNNSSSSQGDRSQKVIELINEKKDISIKDIVSYFKEYSQKTIQRDLAALVEEGKIKRIGEKRWSRYSII